MRFTVVTLLVSFVAGLLCAPPAARAQGAEKTWRLGVLATLPRPADANPDDSYNAFLQELRSLGYIEGKNVVIEWRATGGSTERRRLEVSALVAWKPDVIVAVTAIDAETIRNEDGNVAVVLAGAGNDLVAAGIVKSLARPGGNTTGIQMLQAETAPKRLQILKELVPGLQNVAILRGLPATPTPAAQQHVNMLRAELEGASRELSVRLRDTPVAPGDDLDRVFAGLQHDADAVILDTNPYLTGLGIRRLVDLAIHHGLPTMYDFAQWVEAGGLVSYGPNLRSNWRRTAHFVDRIFKGERPAAMPVEQPGNFQLIINLKTAKALNLRIPRHLLLFADRVIE